MSPLISKPEKAALTSAEAAFYIGVAESTLRKWRTPSGSDGKRDLPPYIQLGRSIRYLKSDLDWWLAKHRVHTGPEKS